MENLSLPLNREEIQGILPHRDPFLLIDEVTKLEPGKMAEAKWFLDPALPFFAGHFPGHPVTPGVLLLESMAQTGAVCVLCMPEMQGKIALFGGAENVKFRKSVLPGDTVTMQVTMTKLSRMAGKGEGIAYVGGEIACQAEILFVIAK